MIPGLFCCHKCVLAAARELCDKQSMADERAVEMARRLGAHPAVLAVALAGSRGAGAEDARSDYDLYVYQTAEVPVEFRRAIAGAGAEIDNRFWETGDEWREVATGARYDVMYRSPEWIADQLARVLVRHEASVGYSTCFWYNVLHAEALYDPQGWYAALQQSARVEYPWQLQVNIIAKNLPVLRRNQSSYRYQIALALGRGDLVSVQHRTTALLASWFDLWFALERQPHPGEKRLLKWLPREEASLVTAVLEAKGDALLAAVDALVDCIEERVGRAKL